MENCSTCCVAAGANLGRLACKLLFRARRPRGAPSIYRSPVATRGRVAGIAAELYAAPRGSRPRARPRPAAKVPPPVAEARRARRARCGRAVQVTLGAEARSRCARPARLEEATARCGARVTRRSRPIESTTRRPLRVRLGVRRRPRRSRGAAVGGRRVETGDGGRGRHGGGRAGGSSGRGRGPKARHIRVDLATARRVDGPDRRADHHSAAGSTTSRRGGATVEWTRWRCSLAAFERAAVRNHQARMTPGGRCSTASRAWCATWRAPARQAACSFRVEGKGDRARPRDPRRAGRIRCSTCCATRGPRIEPPPERRRAKKAGGGQPSCGRAVRERASGRHHDHRRRPHIRRAAFSRRPSAKAWSISTPSAVGRPAAARDRAARIHDGREVTNVSGRGVGIDVCGHAHPPTLGGTIEFNPTWPRHDVRAAVAGAAGDRARL